MRGTVAKELRRLAKKHNVPIKHIKKLYKDAMKQGRIK